MKTLLTCETLITPISYRWPGMLDFPAGSREYWPPAMYATYMQPIRFSVALGKVNHVDILRAILSVYLGVEGCHAPYTAAKQSDCALVKR